MSMQIEFVSPEDILYSGQGTQVLARTRGGGDIAFLTGHEPFIGSLEPSEVRVYEDDGSVRSFVVRGGFVSVTGTEVTVLSDAAIPASEIDIAEAKADLVAAEAAEAENPEDVYARLDRVWAEVRIRVAGEAAS